MISLFPSAYADDEALVTCPELTVDDFWSFGCSYLHVCHPLSRFTAYSKRKRPEAALRDCEVRASPPNYLFFSLILNERCSSKLPIPSSIPIFFIAKI
jgi:hypothetical protein